MFLPFSVFKKCLLGFHSIVSGSMDSDNDGRGTDHAGDDTLAHESKEQSGGGPPKGKMQINASISKVISTLEQWNSGKPPNSAF